MKKVVWAAVIILVILGIWYFAFPPATEAPTSETGNMLSGDGALPEEEQDDNTIIFEGETGGEMEGIIAE